MAKTKIKDKVTKGIAKNISKEAAKEIGKVTHFFDKIGVAVIELTDKLNVGDKILVKGMTSEFRQVVDSMQVEHKEIKSAKKGAAIGMKVKDRVRPNDRVYLDE